MYCPSCGTQNAEGAKFCQNCASPLNASQYPPQHIPTPFSSAPPYPPPGGVVSDGLKIGIAIVSFFVPLVGIIMGIIYMSDSSTEKKAAGKLWILISVVSILVGFGSCCFFGRMHHMFRPFSRGF